MMNLFNRDPLKEMARYRARADRAAVVYLESHAVAGTITRMMVNRVAALVNHDPHDLIAMIPDRRSERRYTAAVAGLNKAGLLERHDDE